MKLLFLDIDGVLNTFQGEMCRASVGKCAHQNYPYNGFDHDVRPHDFHQFLSLDWCPVAVSNLTWLIRSVPDLRIVVSSVWRFGHTQDDMRWLFVHYPEIFDRVIGRTPEFRQKPRGEEIQAYLDKVGHTGEFVIIDDDADMVHLMPHLVLTDSLTGFNYHDMEKAFTILKVDREAFSKQWFKYTRDK